MSSYASRLILHLGFGAAILVLSVILLATDKVGSMTTVNNFTTSVENRWSSYALTLVAVGTLAMALLEAVKGIGDLRHWFHVWKLQQWIGRGKEYEDLVFLAIGDRKRTDALCAQPLDKMMGQIQAAANVALEFPEESKALYNFLTTTDFPASAEASGYVTVPPSDDRAKRDRDIWALAAMDEGRSSTATDPSAPSGEFASAQARIRLTNLVARKLDAFQLRTQYYWERANQLASMLISILIVWYALGSGTADFTLGSVAFGVLAGMLSPVAKDLANNLSQLTKK